jgi:hypothetical protein
MIAAEEQRLSDELRAAYRCKYPGFADKIAQFDPRIYYEANPDVAANSRSSEDLIRHFCEFGYREYRLYAVGMTYKALFAAAFPHLAARLERFDPEEYKRANRDLEAIASERGLYDHYCRFGIDEPRAMLSGGGVIDRRPALARVTGRPFDRDLRVFARIFFPDIAAALRPYLVNLSAMGAQIGIAFSQETFVPKDMADYAAGLRREHENNADVIAVPNEGRDWSGFHALWQRFLPADGSAVFFLHSKKSVHMAPISGEMWRNELLAPICGSYGAVLDAVDKLDAGYSMVGSLPHRSRNVGSSRELIEELLPRLKLNVRVDDNDFVAGTMFAVRGDVLNAFFGGLTGAVDFGRGSKEASMFDGSMAHACERLIGYFAAERGKGIAWVL